MVIHDCKFSNIIFTVCIHVYLTKMMIWQFGRSAPFWGAKLCYIMVTLLLVCHNSMIINIDLCDLPDFPFFDSPVVLI